jgi:hypothetical protein
VVRVFRLEGKDREAPASLVEGKAKEAAALATLLCRLFLWRGGSLAVLSSTQSFYRFRSFFCESIQS